MRSAVPVGGQYQEVAVDFGSDYTVVKVKNTVDFRWGAYSFVVEFGCEDTSKCNKFASTRDNCDFYVGDNNNVFYHCYIRNVLNQEDTFGFY